MRREFTKNIKILAFHRAEGRCEKCTAKLFPGNIHFDHRNPDGLTGEPTLENCQVLCRTCHAIKTKADVSNIARAKRREARHIGAHRSRNPIRGWRKFDRTPVRNPRIP